MVVEAGTTYTPVVVTPTLAFVFSLKVFAICVYPNAIARAVTSSSDAPPPPPLTEAFITATPPPTVGVTLLLKFKVVTIPAGVPLFCIKTPVATPTPATLTSVLLFMSPTTSSLKPGLVVPIPTC